jgi:hypothetical protein
MPLAGHGFALAGMMSFARYVVLDVQGLIEHSPRPTAAEPKPQAIASITGDAKAVSQSTAPATIPARRTAAEAAPAARWDANDDAESDEEDAGQFLSKSERKRLRKQQRRAA